MQRKDSQIDNMQNSNAATLLPAYILSFQGIHVVLEIGQFHVEIGNDVPTAGKLVLETRCPELQTEGNSVLASM